MKKYLLILGTCLLLACGKHPAPAQQVVESVKQECPQGLAQPDLGGNCRKGTMGALEAIEG